MSLSSRGTLALFGVGEELEQINLKEVADARSALTRNEHMHAAPA